MDFFNPAVLPAPALAPGAGGKGGVGAGGKGGKGAGGADARMASCARAHCP